MKKERVTSSNLSVLWQFEICFFYFEIKENQRTSKPLRTNFSCDGQQGLQIKQASNILLVGLKMTITNKY